jgi:hypothetical protein
LIPNDLLLSDKIVQLLESLKIKYIKQVINDKVCLLFFLGQIQKQDIAEFYQEINQHIDNKIERVNININSQTQEYIRILK